MQGSWRHFYSLILVFFLLFIPKMQQRENSSLLKLGSNW